MSASLQCLFNEEISVPEFLQRFDDGLAVGVEASERMMSLLATLPDPSEGKDFFKHLEFYSNVPSSLQRVDACVDLYLGAVRLMMHRSTKFDTIGDTEGELIMPALTAAHDQATSNLLFLRDLPVAKGYTVETVSVAESLQRMYEAEVLPRYAAVVEALDKYEG
jgi:hypothetical protein